MTSIAKNPEQTAAIARVHELLAAAGLPLYGDIYGSLARIISIKNGSADNFGRGQMVDVLAGAAALVEWEPATVSDEPQPHQRVNIAFSKMPYGGSIGFARITDADTRAEAFGKIEKNLAGLADTLSSTSSINDARESELSEYRSALDGIGKAFELIGRRKAAK